MAGSSKRGLNASKSRSSGMKGGASNRNRAPRIATRDVPAPQLPGEKRVRSTTKTVDMKPLKVSREAKRPLDSRAIDRRKTT